MWAGTPMLTLPGEPQTSRVAFSLLRAVGQPETVTHTIREYEERVVELTADPVKRMWET